MSAAQPAKAIRLSFDRRARLPGQPVKGHVRLYFPALMEENIVEVVVRLQGSLSV